MRTIYEAKEFVRGNKGKNVLIKVLGIRNKNEYIDGIISECYQNLFMVDTINGKKSFTYTDYLIGNILIKLK